jgi:hypothetical protein
MELAGDGQIACHEAIAKTSETKIIAAVSALRKAGGANNELEPQVMVAIAASDPKPIALFAGHHSALSTDSHKLPA